MAVAEYALGLAVLLIATIGAISHLEEGSRDEVVNQAACISDRPPPASCQIPVVDPLLTTTTVSDPGGDPGDPPPPTEASFLTTEALPDPFSPSGWSVRVVFEVVEDDDGTILPVEGANVRVRFTVTQPSVQPVFYLDCLTGPGGRCEVVFSPSLVTATQVQVGIDDVIGPGERVPADPPSDVLVSFP